MKYTLLYLALIAFLPLLQAQDKHNYTDHKPQYRKWLDSYILDKIKYTPTSTIFYFRFVCNNANSGGATFYPPGGEFPWYLKGRDVNREYDITAVKNIKRDGIVVKSNVSTEPFHSNPSGPTGHTIFSCEVHFPRLADDMKEADLIEGKGQEFNRRHFNCFNIKLKTWDDEDLGSEEDSKNTVSSFEEKFTGKTTNVNQAPTKEEENYPSTSRKLKTKEDLVCGELIILENIKFHDNSVKFKGMIAANKTLFLVSNHLKDNPNIHLTLYGHSDIFGDKERNLELSRQRVFKVFRWLNMYGIPSRRITYEFFGSEKPLIPEGGIDNRRVEMKLDCK